MTHDEMDALYLEMVSRKSSAGGKILTPSERKRHRSLGGLHGPDRVSDPLAFREWVILNNAVRAEAGCAPANTEIEYHGR